MTKVGILTSRRGHCSHDLLLELESEPYYLDYAAEDDAVDGMGQRQGTPTLRHFDCRKGSKRICKMGDQSSTCSFQLANCNCSRPRKLVPGGGGAGQAPGWSIQQQANRPSQVSQHGRPNRPEIQHSDDAVALNIYRLIFIIAVRFARLHKSVGISGPATDNHEHSGI